MKIVLIILGIIVYLAIAFFAWVLCSAAGRADRNINEEEDK